MRKIINGKLYDTDTATMIDWWQNMANYGDFGYYKEILYRKKTGEFFLHGYGNAASRYAEVQADRTRSQGEKIVPLAIKEAMVWLENYSDADTYIEIFGEVEE